MPRPTSTVWEHFSILSEADGKKHVKCCFCSMQYKHAMANKLKRHLSKCNKSPNYVKKLFRENDITTIRQSSKVPEVNVSTSTSSGLAPSSSKCDPDFPDASYNTTFTTQPSSHSEIDIALARAMYATGQSMSLLESEHWKRVFHLLDPSYTVPTRRTLSNTFLDIEYERVKNEIDVKLSKSIALALIIDGWTNAIDKGVINFIITTPEPIFYHAVYPEVHSETSNFIGRQIIHIINEIGPAKFVILVTDHTENMRNAWRIIRREFPHITCIVCLSHSLNLIYKDIFKKIDIFKATLDKIVHVVKFIKDTHEALSEFEKCQVEKFGSSARSLKLFSKTYWSGALITVNSYKQNKEALELLALSNNDSITQEIWNIILDTKIWIAMDEIINILDPIATGLLSSEKDNALLSDAPLIFKKILQDMSLKLEESVFLDAEEKDVVFDSISKRRKMCVQPIHFAAHLLDPRYCERNILTDEEVSQASEFIRKYCAGTGINEAETLSSMAEFYTKANFFDTSKAIWAPAKRLEPRLWWRTFASNQSIGMLATKLLSVPPSTAAAKRNLIREIKTSQSERHTSQCNKSENNEKDDSSVQFSDQSEDDYDSDSQSDFEISDAKDPLAYK